MTSPRRERRRALVVTSGRDRGSLTAIRALHRAGWSVGVGTPNGGGMVTASRGCARRHVVPRPPGDSSAFVAAVRAAVVAGVYDVVFGGGDDWAAALATYAADIPTAVAHPPADVVLAGLDKVGLAQRAAAAGLSTPRTVPASPSALDAWVGPVVVKCRTHWHPGQRHELRVEARRFDDVDEARARVEMLSDAGFEPVLQQPVDGSLQSLIGLFDGRLTGRVQQTSTALWPTPSGVTCRAVTVPVDEDLARRATHLLTDLGWSGLVQLQFLRDGAGTPHLIDLNGRFFGSMALSLAAGPNHADAWGRTVLGEDVPHLADGRPGVRFAWGVGDLRRATVERRGGLVADLWSVLRWRPGAAGSVWALRDPGPALTLVRGLGGPVRTRRTRPRATPPPTSPGPPGTPGPRRARPRTPPPGVGCRTSDRVDEKSGCVSER